MHGDLRRRFDSGEPGARSLLAGIAELAERGRAALLAGRGAELGSGSRGREERAERAVHGPSATGPCTVAGKSQARARDEQQCADRLGADGRPQPL